MAKKNGNNLVLKARIIERFGSSSAFAEHMQVTEQIVSRVIHGRRQLSRGEEVRWLVALEVPFDQAGRYGLDGPQRPPEEEEALRRGEQKERVEGGS